MASTDPTIPSASTSAERPTPPAPSATPTTPTPQGPGVVKRTTRTASRILLFALGVFAALFGVFNSQNVEVRWFFGDPIQTPLILALAVTFIAGAAIGWLTAKLRSR